MYRLLSSLIHINDIIKFFPLMFFNNFYVSKYSVNTYLCDDGLSLIERDKIGNQREEYDYIFFNLIIYAL